MIEGFSRNFFCLFSLADACVREMSDGKKVLKVKVSVYYASLIRKRKAAIFTVAATPGVAGIVRPNITSFQKHFLHVARGCFFPFAVLCIVFFVCARARASRMTMA